MKAETPMMRRFKASHGTAVEDFYMRWGPPAGYSNSHLEERSGIPEDSWARWAREFDWPRRGPGLKPVGVV